MNNALHQLDEIIAMISEARDAVQSGAYIDLAEIQGLVSEVCAKLQQSPPQDGTPIEDKIVSMIADLNLLAGELTQQQKHTGSEVIRRAVRKNYLKNQDS